MAYKDPRSTVRRVPSRGAYDEASVHAILDAGFVGQVSFAVDGQPFQVPMLYGREGGVLYLHASRKSRFYKVLAEGAPCCLGVTFCDGLVLARSAFHHSVNYRSVVVFGKCRPITDPEEKMTAFRTFTDAIVPGRFDECRPMQVKEAEVTGVLALEIESASAKTRTGGPNDDPADVSLPMWAGTVPMETVFGAVIGAEDMREDYPLPESVVGLGVGRGGRTRG